MTYDLRGRKLTLANPDSGTWSYEYNGAGELVRQTDAKLQVTRTFYDALGRAVERREHPGAEATTPFVTVTSYDRYADASACAYGKGKACEVRTATVTRSSVGGALPSPQVRQFTQFDTAGRATRGTTELDGRSFVTTTTFDANGRVDKLQHPSGYMVVHRYTAWSGALDQVAEWTGSATGQVHWLATARYPDGQLGTAQVGNTNLARDYDGFGRVKAIAAGVGGNPVSLQNQSLTFDAVGNLTNRTETVLTPANQSYAYDRVDRMTSDAGSAVSYDAAGNIQSRAGTAYSYVAGTHRMTSHGATGYGYDANGNVTSIAGGHDQLGGSDENRCRHRAPAGTWPSRLTFLPKWENLSVDEGDRQEQPEEVLAAPRSRRCAGPAAELVRRSTRGEVAYATGHQGPVRRCEHLQQQPRRVQRRWQQVPIGGRGAVPGRNRLGEIRRDACAVRPHRRGERE
jgi:YD repeat-containing protein